MIVLTNCDIFLEDEVLTDQDLVVDAGLVVSMQRSSLQDSSKRVDLKGASVCPGFVDLQVNGAEGTLFNDDASLEAVEKVVLAHRRLGTTSICPTTFSASIERMKELADSCTRYRRNHTGEAVCGIHFEGPIINPRKAGIHLVQDYDLDEVVDFYIQVAQEMPTIVTLAPEVAGIENVEKLSNAGAVVLLGHTEASYECAQAALTAGAFGATHLFNAMSQLSSREPGTIGAIFDAKARFSLIGDGHHVHWSNIKRSLRNTRKGSAFWVSDANSLLGRETSTAIISGQRITRSEDVCVNDDGVLAGSCLSISSMVKRSVQIGGIPRPEAVRMASYYPAKLLRGAKINAGFANNSIANFLIMNNELDVLQVYFEGELCVAE